MSIIELPRARSGAMNITGKVDVVFKVLAALVKKLGVGGTLFLLTIVAAVAVGLMVAITTVTSVFKIAPPEDTRQSPTTTQSEPNPTITQPMILGDSGIVPLTLEMKQQQTAAECDTRVTMDARSVLEQWTTTQVAPVVPNFDWDISCVKTPSGSVAFHEGFTTMNGSLRYITRCFYGGKTRKTACNVSAN
jgi:hypothetical protein